MSTNEAMTPAEKNALNRELAEKLRFCRHEWDSPVLHGQLYQCKLCGIMAGHPWHPDFIANPTLVLREMMKRKDWDTFIYRLYNTILEDHDGNDPLKYFIVDYILDTTEGNLARVAME